MSIKFIKKLFMVGLVFAAVALTSISPVVANAKVKHTKSKKAKKNNARLKKKQNDRKKKLKNTKNKGKKVSEKGKTTVTFDGKWRDKIVKESDKNGTKTFESFDKFEKALYNYAKYTLSFPGIDYKKDNPSYKEMIKLLNKDKYKLMKEVSKSVTDTALNTSFNDFTYYKYIAAFGFAFYDELNDKQKLNLYIIDSLVHSGYMAENKEKKIYEYCKDPDDPKIGRRVEKNENNIIERYLNYNSDIYDYYHYVDNGFDLKEFDKEFLENDMKYHNFSKNWTKLCKKYCPGLPKKERDKFYNQINKDKKLREGILNFGKKSLSYEMKNLPEGTIFH